jgi:lysophospholipase L1-like esterase
MGNLVAFKPKDTFPHLLQVPGGLTAAKAGVQGGDGTAAPLALSTGVVDVTGTLQLGGAAVTAAGKAVATAADAAAQRAALGAVGAGEFAPLAGLDLTPQAAAPAGAANGDVWAQTVAPHTLNFAATVVPVTRRLGADHQVAVTPRAFTRRLVLCGSSVTAGDGASLGTLSWAGRLAAAIGASEYGSWSVDNRAVAGQSSTAVETNFYTDVAPLVTPGTVVVVGLGFFNEGFFNWTTDNDRKPVFDGYVSRIERICQRIEQQGGIPVVGGPYPHATSTAGHLPWFDRFYRHFDDRPWLVLDFFSALHGANGQWKAGTNADNTHPNDVGHGLMFDSVPLDFFKSPHAHRRAPLALDTRQEGPCLRLTNPGGTGRPLAYDPAGLNSFTFSFQFRRTAGTGVAVAGWDSSNNGRLRNPAGFDVAGGQAAFAAGCALRRTDADWHTVTVVRNAAEGTGGAGTAWSWYLDGELVEAAAASAGDRAAYAAFTLGGRYDGGSGVPGLLVKNVLLYRVPLAADAVRRVHRGRPPRAGLELCHPCADGPEVAGAGVPLANLMGGTRHFATALAGVWAPAVDRAERVNVIPTSLEGASPSLYQLPGGAGDRLPGRLTVAVDNTAGANVGLTIPDPATCPGRPLTVRDHSGTARAYPVLLSTAGGGAVVDPVTGEQVAVREAGGAVTVASDGTAWAVVAAHRPTVRSTRLTAVRAEQAGTAFTLGTADHGTLVECTGAAPVTVTLSAAAAADTFVTVAQLGAGAVTPAAAAGATLSPAGGTAGPGETVTLYVRANPDGASAQWAALGGAV